MSTPANVIPLYAAPSARGRVPGSLGACPECVSERLAPLVRTGHTDPEAVRCEACGLVLSMAELDSVRAGRGSTAPAPAPAPAPTPADELEAEIDEAIARTRATLDRFRPRDTLPLAGYRKGWDR